MRLSRRWLAALGLMAALAVGVVLRDLMPARSAEKAGRQAEQLYSLDCPSKQNWRDSALVVNELCPSTIDVVENGLKWRILILESGRPGINWVVLHDDEDTAFDSAIYAAVRYGGKVVAVELRPSSRPDAVVDPNGNFAATAEQGRTCGGLTALGAPLFTSTIIEELGAPPYVALHNNRDGHFRSGGSGNISVQQADERLFGLPAFNSIGRLADEDNVIIVSGLAPPSRLPNRMRLLTDRLRDSGINVIYERVRQAFNNCSLSNYLLLYGGAEPGQYFNIEAEFGDYNSPISMINTLIQILAEQ